MLVMQIVCEMSPIVFSPCRLLRSVELSLYCLFEILLPFRNQRPHQVLIRTKALDLPCARSASSSSGSGSGKVVVAKVVVAKVVVARVVVASVVVANVVVASVVVAAVVVANVVAIVVVANVVSTGSSSGSSL